MAEFTGDRLSDTDTQKLFLDTSASVPAVITLRNSLSM
jgi:hypothetical protein